MRDPKGFDAITRECLHISLVPFMMPVVCLGKDAFPVVTTDLMIADPLDAEVTLPFVAGAISGQGRVICFPQLELLERQRMRTAHTANFLKNAINWISGGQNVVGPILALGFNEANDSGGVSNLQELGFVVEKKPCESANLSDYRVVIVPSDLELSGNDLLQQLVGFVHNSGGGLAVFYRHSPGRSGVIPMPINELLWNFDLAFTGCVMEEVGDGECIQVPPAFAYNRNCALHAQVQLLKTLFKFIGGESSPALNNMVMTLKYYLMGCGERHSDQLSEIGDSVSQYLERMKTEEVCTEVQTALTILLTDVYAVLPPERPRPVPVPVLFQGEGDRA